MHNRAAERPCLQNMNEWCTFQIRKDRKGAIVEPTPTLILVYYDRRVGLSCYTGVSLFMARKSISRTLF